MWKNSSVVGWKGGVVIAVLLLLVVMVPQRRTAAEGSRKPEVTYTFIVQDPASHIMHVEVDIQHWRGGVLSFNLMSYQTLTFTVGLFCSPKTRKFPWHYSNVKAFTSDGKALPVRVFPAECDRCDARVEVSAGGQTHFILAYDLMPIGGQSFARLPDEHYDRLASYLGDRFGFFFERYGLFLPLQLSGHTKVHFRFKLPEGWVALTPWQVESEGFVTTLDTLREPSWYWGSGVAMGPFVVQNRQIGPTLVRVGVSRSIPEEDKKRAFRVAFGSFEFMQKKYGPFPSSTLMIVVVDEPSAHPCNGRYENNPVLDLLRGDATVFAAYQELIGGPGERRGSPAGWQGIPDEVSYLWMETSASHRNVNLDCWVMYQGNPILYTYATYQTGVWDTDWRGTGYHFTNPKVWCYMRCLDYLMNWENGQWELIGEKAMPLDYEIQRRTLGYFHLWDVVGRIYREGTNPCSTSVLLTTIKKVTGQDFTPWFQKYILGPDAPKNLARDYYKDSDGDGVWDWIEEDLGLDPHNPDTDGDGLTDGQEMGVRWASDNPTFTDPLCPETQRGENGCSRPQTLPPSQQDNTSKEEETLLAPEQVTLEGAKVQPDGNVEEWGAIKPIKTDPQEPHILEDITALYVTKDDKFLYLRVDGRFGSGPDAQMTIDITAKPMEGKTILAQASTLSNESTILHLIPVEANGKLDFETQAIYAGAAWENSTYEAVIPWNLLGGAPKDTTLKVYIVQGGRVVEALPKVEIAWFLTPQPSPQDITPTVASQGGATPSVVSPSTPVYAASVTPSSASPSGAHSEMLFLGAAVLLFMLGIVVGRMVSRR